MKLLNKPHTKMKKLLTQKTKFSISFYGKKFHSQGVEILL